MSRVPEWKNVPTLDELSKALNIGGLELEDFRYSRELIEVPHTDGSIEVVAKVIVHAELSVSQRHD